MKKSLLIFLFIPVVSFSQQTANCRESGNPLVLVHGFLASGDTWSTQVQRFLANGYCRERIFVFDWNTTGGNRKKTDSLLGVWIDSARLLCRSEKVDLVGHSAGGGLCYGFLADSARSLKVAHYAHLGSSAVRGPAGFNGNIPTLIVSSEKDKVTGGLKKVAGVRNILQKDNDHSQVQTSGETFRELYAFLQDGNKPLLDSVHKRLTGTVRLSGKCVGFGDNEPVRTDSILLYLFDPSTGQRRSVRPIQILASNPQGYWPAVDIPAGEYTEFEVHPPHGRVISYFMEPQPGDNSLIYLRCLPFQGLVSAMLKKLPQETGSSVVAVFSANQAIISGRDSMAVGDLVLSSPSLAPAAKTILASFIFDDGDGLSSGNLIKSFGAGVFLNGIDTFIPAGRDRSLRLYFNGRTIKLPCRPSSETLMVAIFN